MVNKPLNLKYVYKRQRYLEKRKTITESATMIDLSNCPNNNVYSWRLENFFNNCTDYRDALSVLETLYNENKFDLLEKYSQVVNNDIIPLVENFDLSTCIETIENSNIGQVNIDRLTESAKTYKSIDRIIKNHKNLSRKFNLEQFSNKTRSDKDKIYSICEKVDTYTLSPFIKMNIALEELSYLCYSEGVEIAPEDIVKNVTEYFLLRDNNTKDDINSYRKAIRESKIIPYNSDKNISYFINESTKFSSYWNDKLNEWKINPNKSINTIIELAKNNLNDIIALSEINSTINDFIRINSLDFDSKKIFESIESLNGNEAHNIMTLIKENNIEDTESLVENLTLIWEADINDDIYYADGNKENMTFTASDIDSYKLHNLVTDAQDAGEFLSKIEKTSAKESPLNIHRIKKEEDTINDENIMNHIDSNDHISMNLGTYSYKGSVEEAYNFIDSTIKCLNNILHNRDSYSYYVLGENSFDIYLRSKYSVILSESQKINKDFSTYEKAIICDLNEISNILENLILETPLVAIIDKLHDRKYAGTISIDEANLVYDIINPYLDYDTFNEFTELCREEANPKYNYIKYISSNIEKEPFNLYEDHKTRLEFCADVMNINEDAIERAKGNIRSAVNDLNPAAKLKSSKNIQNTSAIQSFNKDNYQQQKKSEKNPVSMNDVKLAWTGVKGKLKNASAKEKEFSRDLDMEFNHLCKSVQNGLGLNTDHREEIITGQVKRSLSKSIKILITWAGIGAIAGMGAGVTATVGAATAAVLGPIVLWAKSKLTSRAEKMQILDEIDIELKVVERELHMAESEGSTKKYRALLTIQKNLQRKRQEIYYGLARKGKRVPLEPVKGLERG